MRVNNYLDHVYKELKGTEKSELHSVISKLSENLQNELVFEVNQKHI